MKLNKFVKLIKMMNRRHGRNVKKLKSKLHFIGITIIPIVAAIMKFAGINIAKNDAERAANFFV